MPQLKRGQSRSSLDRHALVQAGGILSLSSQPPMTHTLSSICTFSRPEMHSLHIAHTTHASAICPTWKTQTHLLLHIADVQGSTAEVQVHLEHHSRGVSAVHEPPLMPALLPLCRTTHDDRSCMEQPAPSRLPQLCRGQVRWSQLAGSWHDSWCTRGRCRVWGSAAIVIIIIIRVGAVWRCATALQAETCWRSSVKVHKRLLLRPSGCASCSKKQACDP